MEEKGLNQMTNQKRSRAGKIGTKARKVFDKRRQIFPRNVNVNDNNLEKRKTPILKMEKLKLNNKSKIKSNRNFQKTETNVVEELIEENKIKNIMRVDDFMIYEYEKSESIRSAHAEDLPNENYKNQEIPLVQENEKGQIEFLTQENLYEDSDDMTHFSKIFEVEDENYKILPPKVIESGSNINTNFYTTTLQSLSKTNSIEKENFTNSSNKIFNLEKINNKAKSIKDNQINDKSDSTIKENFSNDDEKNSFNENFSFFTNNLNRTSIINFNTYKPQIKINNYFIKHKSAQFENSIQNISDVNNQKRFLTKPCIICQKARFAKNELLKLQTCEEFMLSFNYFIKQAELKIEQNNFKTTNLEIFYNNKKLYEEFFEKNYKFDKNALKKNFRRGKRICADCFENLIENQPLGANELLELIMEEDEQAELDETKKNEIFSEIKKFMYMNGYDVDKSFPIFSNSVDLSEEDFNIFNLIFSRKRADNSTSNRFTSNGNNSSPNKTTTNYNSNRTKLSEVNNTLPNLSNFNDKPKSSNQGGCPQNKISICQVSSAFKEQPHKESVKVNLNECQNEVDGRPIQILKSQCEFIKNVMTFEQLVMLQIMKSVDDYIVKLTMLSKNIQVSVNFMSNTIKIYRDKKFNEVPLNNSNDNKNHEGNPDEIQKQIELNNLLRKNLNDNSAENNQKCEKAISMEYGEIDEKTILENLSKLLNLNRRVTHVLAMFKTIMNYFANYFPIFCRNLTGHSFYNIFQNLNINPNNSVNPTKINEEEVGNKNPKSEVGNIMEAGSENVKGNLNENLNQNLNSMNNLIGSVEKNNLNENSNNPNKNQENFQPQEDSSDRNRTQNDPLTFPLRPFFANSSN